MSVPRKGRLPAWHLLTDEGGSVNSRCLSALFPSAAQAHAAAEVLERRGALLLAMETEPRSTPQPLRRFPNLVGLDLTHCLRGVRAFARSRGHLCAWSRLRVGASCACDESRSSEKFIHGIKVLMVKNFIDNLSEETRKGMVEKASQGIWPSYAPIG